MGVTPLPERASQWTPWEFINTNVYYRPKAAYIHPNRVSNRGETTEPRRWILDSGDQERPSSVSRKRWLSNVAVQWTNLESPKKHWVLAPTVWISDFIGMRNGFNIWILKCSQVVLTCLKSVDHYHSVDQLINKLQHTLDWLVKTKTQSDLSFQSESQILGWDQKGQSC